MPFEGDGTPKNDPRDPERFARDFAAALNRLMNDAEMAKAFGKAGRERVVAHFSWSSIADQTLALYQKLLGQ